MSDEIDFNGLSKLGFIRFGTNPDGEPMFCAARMNNYCWSWILLEIDMNSPAPSAFARLCSQCDNAGIPKLQAAFLWPHELRTLSDVSDMVARMGTALLDDSNPSHNNWG